MGSLQTALVSTPAFKFPYIRWLNGRERLTDASNREYRTGETCGMKLIMQTVPISTKCKLCEKIDTKIRRRQAEVERISRWKREGSKFSASIDRSADIVKSLEKEINDLGYERQRRLHAIG